MTAARGQDDDGHAMIDVSTWPVRVAGDMRGRLFAFNDVDSTQDVARREGTVHGDVVAAIRQTHGRGRLGSVWQGDDVAGLAVTFVVKAAMGERLAVASAVGAITAIDALAPDVGAGIKWPNDIYAGTRKLAGILIEQERTRAFIGIGINVRSRVWPAEIPGVSLQELGVRVAHVDLLAALVRSVPAALAMDQDALVTAYNDRSVLTGRTVVLRGPAGEVTGCVRGLDLERGLGVDTASGPVWFPAATTRVANWNPALSGP